MSTAVIPEPIAQLQRQLDQIRNTQPREKKLPDSVWQAAVEHRPGTRCVFRRAPVTAGLYRAEETAWRSFLELIAPSSAMLRECHATLYTESSDSFLPPLPPRLLPGGANPFPGGSCTRAVKRLSRHTVTPTMGSSRRNRADGPSSVSMFWVEPYHLAFGRQL
jgi:hypothetical protein